MSVSTPSKEQRAERHLMRIRGAGKIARAISQDLFAFTITNSTGKDKSCSEPARVPSSKRSKLDHNSSLAAKAPITATESTVTSGQINSGESASVSVSQIDSKACGRQTAAKATKETHALPLQDHKALEVLAVEASNTGDDLLTSRGSKTTSKKTRVKTATRPAKSLLVPTEDDSAAPQKVASSDRLDRKDAPISTGKNEVVATVANGSASNIQIQPLEAAISQPGTYSEPATAPKTAIRSSAKHVTARAKPSQEPMKKPTTVNRVAKRRADDLPRPASRPARKRQALAPNEDDMEFLPPSRSSLDLIKKAVPQPRQALASISPNRGTVLPLSRSASTKMSKLDQPRSPTVSKSCNVKDTQMLKIVSDSDPRHIAQPNAQSRPDSSRVVSRLDMLSKQPPQNRVQHDTQWFSRPATKRPRKRERPVDDEDFDLDDLITNITTLTKGIEHRLPKSSTRQ